MEKESNYVDKYRTALKGFNKLFIDYFPSAQNSSTEVKISACLAEATSTTGAISGAILLADPAKTSLRIVATYGTDIEKSKEISVRGNNLASRVFANCRNEILEKASEEDFKEMGIKLESAVCTIINPNRQRGVMLLWSNEPSYFKNLDLEIAVLFSGYLAILLEVDEISTRLAESLSTDPLTGLYNKRQFEERLHLELSRAKRYSSKVSLVIFDIDGLGNYNKSNGNILGNLAISDIASILKKETREVDFAARVGDDEFAVILPETGSLGAISLAERICDSVASYPFPSSGDAKTPVLTLSAGIASFPVSTHEEKELLDKAYLALEIAKREGAGKIHLWEREKAK